MTFLCSQLPQPPQQATHGFHVSRTGAFLPQLQQPIGSPGLASTWNTCGEITLETFQYLLRPIPTRKVSLLELKPLQTDLGV